MKSFLLFFTCILTFSFYSQFTDTFTDGDFTNAPTWSGNAADWEVLTGELHLNAPAAGATKYLSTPSTAIDNASWEFYTKLEFDPSSSNYTDIYVASNNSNVSGSLNGYFVRIGGTTDEVSLYKQTGTTKTEIIDGIDGLVSNPSSNKVKVLVTRTAAGAWELQADTNGGYVVQGNVTDNTHLSSSFFGVSCIFTSTRSDKFYFDDFIVTGTSVVDSVKPSVDSLRVLSNTTLDVYFSEPVDATTAQTLTNYFVNNSVGNPTVATRDGSNFSLVHLTFGSVFQNGVFNDLQVSNVKDLANNTMVTQTKQFIYYIPVPANYRDVVINEVFPDPTPSIGLPAQEFVELHNTTTNKVFNLSGWKLSDGSSTATIGNYILLPGAFVIVTSNTALPDFAVFNNAIGVSSFPSLNNSGEELTLVDNTSASIDYMNYTLSVYDGTNKADGGWTIEQVNPLLKCFNKNNWRPSVHFNGGTPGAINSVNDTTPDVTAPQIQKIDVINDTTIEILFSEGVNASFLMNNISITGGLGINNLTPIGNTGEIIQLSLNPAMDTAVIYTITIDSIFDCSGNYALNSGIFVLANAPSAGDLIINEILFNPFTGGYDFLELYNNSSKYIDIYGWRVSNDSLVLGDSIKNHFVLAPGDYLVLTENTVNVQTEYLTHNPNAFLQIPDLPSFNNDKGEVYLYFGTGILSDQFSYTEKMHFPLLNDVDGVSLERLDFNRATNDAGNWHSAAENIGFATPGLKNSQVNPTVFTGKEISVSPDIFSPDNDGIDDVLNIIYNLDNPGYVGNINIYDVNGRKIKTLVDNELLATEGVYTWDGTSDDFTKARIGTYLIFFEVFSEAGEVKSIKKTCVLGHKL